MLAIHRCYGLNDHISKFPKDGFILYSKIIIKIIRLEMPSKRWSALLLSLPDTMTKTCIVRMQTIKRISPWDGSYCSIVTCKLFLYHHWIATSIIIISHNGKFIIIIIIINGRKDESKHSFTWAALWYYCDNNNLSISHMAFIGTATLFDQKKKRAIQN